MGSTHADPVVVDSAGRIWVCLGRWDEPTSPVSFGDEGETYFATLDDLRAWQGDWRALVRAGIAEPAWNM